MLSIRRNVFEVLVGESERVVSVDDHGLMKRILGGGDRGLPMKARDAGDDSAYLSSLVSSVGYSVLESVVSAGLGMMCLNRRLEGCSFGVVGLEFVQEA
jgi:hypothetical protein